MNGLSRAGVPSRTLIGGYRLLFYCVATSTAVQSWSFGDESDGPTRKV